MPVTDMKVERLRKGDSNDPLHGVALAAILAEPVEEG